MEFVRKAGEQVTIYNATGNELYMEGQAKLIRPISIVAEGELERWEVLFTLDEETVERNVWVEGHQPWC